MDILLALRRVGPTKVFLVVLALVLIAFLTPGWAGALLLLVLVAALIAVLTATWPVTPPPMRLIRLLILAGLLVIAVTKVT